MWSASASMARAHKEGVVVIISIMEISDDERLCALWLIATALVNLVRKDT